MPEQPNVECRTPPGVFWATVILGLIILLPSMVGFVNKFYEFLNATRQDADGAYVLTPILNYFLASCGFFCLLIWATLHGMFHDIEAPKQTMLARETDLDAEEATFTPRWAGGQDVPDASASASRSTGQSRNEGRGAGQGSD